MKTPICDFLHKYSNSDSVRLHMPGHKGTGPLGVEKYDITEIDGAGVLYSANGITAESEENARELFGTAKTLYSTEGSSLSIRAMLFMATLYAKKNGQRPLILAARNAHRSFMNGIAMLDAEVEWIYPEDTNGIVSCTVDPHSLEKRLSESKQKPTAVYITSPDYLGQVADVAAISKVCKRHGVLLLVDNAHGAYLAFLKPSRHPIALGADVCADSAHKTLPVITGGGYLHISKNAPGELCEYAPIAMQTFASTSPSYLILSSLDSANVNLSGDFPSVLCEFEKKLRAVALRISEAGFDIISDEPLKLTLLPKNYGYSGTELNDHLIKRKMICDFYDDDALVMMFSPYMQEKELKALEEALLSLPKCEPIMRHAPTLTKKEKALSIREAIMSPTEEIPIDEALGRILGASAIACPPAIPILVAGEIIDENAIELFRYYRVGKTRVIRKLK